MSFRTSKRWEKRGARRNLIRFAWPNVRFYKISPLLRRTIPAGSFEMTTFYLIIIKIKNVYTQ
jgi:hypothetical protein